ncbi:hypothetical protein [Bradyrhizobium diazoefficiens]|nr:hypothetical protein [Bradyrhizobium diazoefficiens]
MADPTVSTDAATKNYVDTTTAAFFSTGDMKPTLKNVADAGWILFDDGTFGSATSGSSSRANQDTQALFTLFFSNMSDSAAPILTSGGGATTRAAQVSAANAWAANCRMSLPKTLGRALGVAGSGAGLTGRSLGASVGEESHTLIAGEIPVITSAVSVSGALTGTTSSNVDLGVGNVSLQTGGNPLMTVSTTGAASVTVSGTLNGAATSNNAGGQAHNNMQPTVFVNWMVKI